jgi:hypothetical protein
LCGQGRAARSGWLAAPSVLRAGLSRAGPRHARARLVRLAQSVSGCWWEGGREGLQLLKGSRGAASSTGGHWTRAEEEGSRRPNGESEEEVPTYGAPTFVENY